MKVVLLVAGGRAGSDFFHSLLDEHSQILQFPGALKIDENLNEILDLKSLKDISNRFIKSYPQFFDSRKLKNERWDKLGKKKNLYFKIDKKKFYKNFIKLSKNKINNKYIIFKNLHYAYALARNKKITKKKIFFIHTHLLQWTKLFLKIFNLKKFEFIYTTRHPLASISSPIKTWLNYNNGSSFFPKDLHYQFNTAINDSYELSKLGKVNIIRLEKIHLENLKTMKNFCKKFNIKYENCLSKSTKNGLQWWGDIFSKRFFSGINKKLKIQISEKYFYERDLIFFQNLTQHLIKRYGYRFYYPKKNILFNLMPMKCELLVWKNTINHLFYKGFRWKHLCSIPIYYLLRILMFNKFNIKSEKKYLPKSVI